MITAFGRSHGIPLLMSLMVEQLFKFASVASPDLKDDTILLNIYRPRGADRPSGSGKTSLEIQIDDIVSLLSGIHAAASVEVLSLARKLGVDLRLLAEIVKDAAGANRALQGVVQLLGTDETDGKGDFAGLKAQSEKLVSIQHPARPTERPLMRFDTAYSDR